MTSPLFGGDLRGVIFDMDGVLCDSEPYMIRAAQTLYIERYGLAVDEQAFEPFYGRGDIEFICGPVERQGVTVDRGDLMAVFFERYFKLIEGDMQALVGAAALVRRVRDRGLKLAVATSSEARKLQMNLQVIGIPPAWFDTLVCAQDVQRKKPAPDLFLTAAERLGLPAKQCLVIEDTPSGVRAAKLAGGACVAVMTNFEENALREAGADVVMEDLARWPAELL